MYGPNTATTPCGRWRSDANTQPFSRGWGGRDWLFAHSGSLQRLELAPASVRLRPSESAIRKASPFDSSPQLPHEEDAEERRKKPRPRTFEPIGSTDTELIFCDLLERFARHGWRSLGEVLANVPGLYVIDDLVLPSVSVRGVSGGLNAGTRIVKVMVDGTVVNFRPDLTAFLGPELIPIEVIDRIEIAKGPLSAVYGANAFLEIGRAHV